MKITLEFDNLEEAKKAIHAEDVWIALLDVNEALRAHTKHDVSQERTISAIQDIMHDVTRLLYA